MLGAATDPAGLAGLKLLGELHGQTIEPAAHRLGVGLRRRLGLLPGFLGGALSALLLLGCGIALLGQLRAMTGGLQLLLGGLPLLVELLEVRLLSGQLLTSATEGLDLCLQLLLGLTGLLRLLPQLLSLAAQRGLLILQLAGILLGETAAQGGEPLQHRLDGRLLRKTLGIGERIHAHLVLLRQHLSSSPHLQLRLSLGGCGLLLGRFSLLQPGGDLHGSHMPIPETPGGLSLLSLPLMGSKILLILLVGQQLPAPGRLVLSLATRILGRLGGLRGAGSQLPLHRRGLLGHQLPQLVLRCAVKIELLFLAVLGTQQQGCIAAQRAGLVFDLRLKPADLLLGGLGGLSQRHL